MAEYLSTAEYAERYGLNPQSVRRMCESGRVPAVKTGKVWRIADHPPGGRASAADEELARLRRDVADLMEWKERMCRVFSAAG